MPRSLIEDRLDEVDLAVIESSSRTQGDTQGAAFRGPRSGIGLCTERRGHLDRRRADTAGPAMNEHAFVRPQTGLLK